MAEEFQRAPLPTPNLAPASITGDQYLTLTPEKLELWEGYLAGPPGRPEARIRLLALLLTNVGLVETLKLAPRERWEQALREAYPQEGRAPLRSFYATVRSP